MIKYAKVTNKETKQCNVGVGTNNAFYQSIGMTEMDVEQAYDGVWYLKGYAPVAPAPTREEIEKARIAYRHEHIDDETLCRLRKQANGTWTQEMEDAYLALDTEVTAYIEEHLPYPTDPVDEEPEVTEDAE